jgi:hypothetical protein
MVEEIFCNLAKNMKTNKSLIIGHNLIIGNTTLFKFFVFENCVIVSNEKYIDCLNLANCSSFGEKKILALKIQNGRKDFLVAKPLNEKR